MFKKYSFGSDLTKRISRLKSGYVVTLPGCDAKTLYYTMIKEHNYQPMLTLPPKVDEARFYNVFAINDLGGEKFVYLYRNTELSPHTVPETLSVAERRNKAAVMARRGFMTWEYVDNMPTR